MEDEPFDTLSGGNPTPQAPPATTQLRKATPSVPPPAAFGKSPASNGPNPASLAAPAASTTNPNSGSLPDRLKEPENKMDAYRSESAVEVNRALASAAEQEATRRFLGEENDDEKSKVSITNIKEQQPNYSNYKLSSQAAKVSTTAGLAPRQPYSFRKSSSYDTDELIRKYGAMTGITPSVSSVSSRSIITEPPKREKPGDVRQEAMKVLTLVDDHLNTPLDIRRTQSGGFRATPHMGGSRELNEDEAPYAVQRTSSGTITSGVSNSNAAGKRVPAALAGLNFSSDNRSSWKAGRYSFTDPSFREDDNVSLEDEIVHDGNFDDAPVIDVVSLENRAMSTRATANNKDSFDGDFPQTPSSWSSRYSDTFASQKRILDQWDREYDNERRTNARNMIMSTASSMRSAAGNAWAEAQSQGEKVFGPGFSFRKNYVFGKQSTDKPDVNLRTVWKDLDGDDGIQGSRVHKSWQEVMLSKKKRRRVLLVLCILLMAVFTIVGITVYGKNQTPAVIASAHGIGSVVSFYVTSDVPYDVAEETKLNKDLSNIPGDAEFVVHLGNIQKASQTFCPWTRYGNVASVLKESPVPMFILPGVEDWTNCPDPATALHNWRDAFFEFDSNFVHGFQVFRDRVHPEAFAMLHNGVLFMGLHIVNGPIHDETDWASREVQMLTFYFGMTNLHRDQFRAVVILGNARPSPQQDELFNTIFNSLKDIKRPMAYIHANSGTGTVREYNPDEENTSVVGIEIEDGGKNPPLKITVGFGERPFLVG